MHRKIKQLLIKKRKHKSCQSLEDRDICSHVENDNDKKIKRIKYAKIKDLINLIG